MPAVLDSWLLAAEVETLAPVREARAVQPALDQAAAVLPAAGQLKELPYIALMTRTCPGGEGTCSRSSATPERRRTSTGCSRRWTRRSRGHGPAWSASSRDARRLGRGVEVPRPGTAARPARRFGEAMPTDQRSISRGLMNLAVAQLEHKAGPLSSLPQATRRKRPAQAPVTAATNRYVPTLQHQTAPPSFQHFPQSTPRGVYRPRLASAETLSAARGAPAASPSPLRPLWLRSLRQTHLPLRCRPAAPNPTRPWRTDAATLSGPNFGYLVPPRGRRVVISRHGAESGLNRGLHVDQDQMYSSVFVQRPLAEALPSEAFRPTLGRMTNVIRRMGRRAARGATTGWSALSSRTQCIYLRSDK